jgi:hypothetical protein
MRRQRQIDWVWEWNLLQKQLRREEAERRSFHKAPGDSDWE